MDSNYIDMLKCLNASGVDYIMVGGWAVNMHGYIRATIDLDIWILANPENASRVYAALADFGAPMLDVSPHDFSEEGIVFQIGVAPCRIDILTHISGVTYADAVKRAIPKQIDGVDVRIISIDDLIANKRASGRTKDLADVEVLEGLKQ